MRRWKRALAVLAVAVVAVGCGADDRVGRASPPSKATSSSAEAGVPPEVRSAADDWPVPGGDYGNRRAAARTRLSSSTIDRLASAWEVPLTGGATTVPLILGDTVYVQDSRGTVQAIDRADGSVRWNVDGSGFNIGPFGVAVGWGKVFSPTSDGVRALSIRDGHELWRRKLTKTPTEGVDIQPVAYDGKVFAATVPVSIADQFHPGDRGVLHALDADTGEEVWSFDTVDSPDLWGHPEINSGGGAWYTPAIDGERGVMYWGTANPSPFPGAPGFPNGASRPGDDLYTESTVALGIDDGKLRWYQQAHPHDLFDRDFVHAMVVPTSAGHVVVGTGKGGLVLGMDPKTGDVRWRATAGVHRNDDLTALTGPTAILPGTFGGIITPPSAAGGVVYVAAVNAPTTLGPEQSAKIGSEVGTMDGEVAAIDATSGEVRWRTVVPGDPFGATTVAGDLVLTATAQGEVLALARSDGHLVWRYRAPGGINGWMAVAGDLVVLPVGQAQPPRLVGLRLRP